MKTKKFVVIAILVFWAFLTAVLLAGLPNTGKSKTNLITGNVITPSDISSARESITQGLSLTKEEVAKHDSSSSCWMIMDNKIYDVTSYLALHPAGESSILAGCGKDATQLYSGIGHSDYAKTLLSKYFIGNLGEELNPNNQTTENITNTTNQTTDKKDETPKNTTNTNTQTSISFSPQEISEHSSSSSCWAYLYNKVYDLTDYIPIHSGGRSQILSICGKNGTSLFESGPHSPSDLAFLNPYFIGNLKITPPETQTDTIPQNIPNTTQENTTQENNTQENTTNSTTPDTNITIPDANITYEDQIPPNITNPNIINPIHSITTQEIARHSYSYNCWSYVNTKVYDFTSYIRRYPGGPGLILNICGKNGTSLFESDPYAPTNLSSIDIYFIGNLSANQTESN